MGMRWETLVLGCLVLSGAGCLNQVARLVGDGGSVDCWMLSGDAGLCTDDSQCPDNYYCDLSLTACPNSVDPSSTCATVSAGSCLQNCGGHGGAPCHSGEDCADLCALCVRQTPSGEVTCTAEQPCLANATCTELTDCPYGGACPAGCHGVVQRHPVWTWACVSDDNTCALPSPGPDAGPDAGIDAGTDAGPDAGPDAGFGDAGTDAGDGGTPRTDAGQYQNLASGDLNGDGILDLVAGWWGDYSGVAPFITLGFDVFYGLADGGLTNPTHYDGGSDGLNFAIADLNGDNVADLVASNVFGVTVYLGLADGGFSIPVAYGLPNVDAGYVYSLGVGDLRGTGTMDLVIASLDGRAGHLYALTNLGDGTFEAGTEIVPSSVNYGPQLLVSDLNHDGFADILEIDGNETLTILLNEGGDGGFAQTVLVLGEYFPGLGPSGAQPMTFFPAAGGNTDLVLSTWSDVSPETWQVLILKNDGDGTFSDAGQFPTSGDYGLYPGYIAIADLNGDGIADLGLSGDGNHVQVLYGAAGGGFGPPQILAEGDQSMNCTTGIAALGSVGAPTAFAVGDACGGGITIIGDASKH